MTLIIGFISNEFVMLASDRRITWKSNGREGRTEDTENKAILLSGCLLMGYTGFARLGGVKTERWVIEKLAHLENLSQYFPTIASETAKEIAAMRIPLRQSGHAYIAVGYGMLRSDSPGQLHATGITVSNALGKEYGAWNPRPDFTITRTSPLRGPKDFRLIMAGIVPKREDSLYASDLIRRYRKRHPDRTLGVAQILVQLIRSVQHNGVGEDISVSILPRCAVPNGSISIPLLGLRDPITQPTCVFAPKNVDLDSATIYVPAMVSPGFMSYGGEIQTGNGPFPE